MNRENRIAEENGMDRRQCDVAYAMVRSGKTVDEILTEYGITEEEFTGWIRDGRFTEYAQTLARGFAEADAPYIWASLLNTAKSGSIPAIKLYFEIWNKRHGAHEAEVPDGLAAVREEIFGAGEEE